MNLEEYRTVFATVSLAMMLISAAPLISLILPFQRSMQPISEFWVLGPGHMLEDYPLNVNENNLYRVFIGITNHVGFSSYYLVYLKFRNESLPLPDHAASVPSPLAAFHELRAFVGDGETWETPLTFRISDVSYYGDLLFVRRVWINNVSFFVNASTRWNSTYKGFFFQLFSELWLYDITSKSFQFQNRFVGIWLNLTGP